MRARASPSDTRPRVVSTCEAVRNEIAAARQRGQRIGLVPTMGALHAGHLSLVEACCRECEYNVVSIFVNPTQFGPNEDFARYPRNLEADLKSLSPYRVQLVFAPSVEEMYPARCETTVDVGSVAEPWEGVFRPGHFRGVATVVLKLFNLVQPDVAYFGQKDYQQTVVVRRMVQDLNVPVEIRVCPTVRDPDGLAISSRNVYLSPGQRRQALALSRGLRYADELVRGGERGAAAVRQAVLDVLEREPEVRVQYVAVADPDTLAEVSEVNGRTLVAVAAFVGTTRLIDNLECGDPSPLSHERGARGSRAITEDPHAGRVRHEMRSTLFHIPNEIWGIPFLKPEVWDYGIGLLLAVVLLCGGILLYSKYRRQGASGDFLGSLTALVVLSLVIVFVVPYITEEGRGLPIRGYGVMLLISVVAGVSLGMWRAKQVGANPEIILSMMFLIFIGGLVGARGLYVIEYWQDFRPDAWTLNGVTQSLGKVLNMTTGGLVVYGSLLGAGVAFSWYVWRHSLPPLALCDIVVASLLLGQGLGRIGCLLNGCCYGGVCEPPNLPKITFPFGSPAHHRQVEEGRVFLHGLKLRADETAEAEVRAYVRQFPKADRPANPKPSAIVEDVETGSAAEASGVRPGQRIVGVYMTDADARQKRAVEKIVTNPTRDEVYKALFALNGEASRDLVTLVVDAEGERQDKSWPATPAELAGTLPVHPTQIYDAINALVMAFFAWCYFPFRRRDGEVFALMLAIFPVSRFLMEWVRTDEPKNWLTWLWADGMTISQAISIGLVLSAIPFWYFVLRQPSGGKLTPAEWADYNTRWAEGVSGP